MVNFARWSALPCANTASAQAEPSEPKPKADTGGR
jgi:hypothetical protein